MIIEKFVRNYLNKQFELPVVMEEETGLITNYLLIEKVGSSGDEHLKRANIAIKSYGPTLAAAANLNEQLKNVMQHLTEENEICKCTLETDYNFTDVERKKYRYQAIFEIIHY